MAQIPDNLKYTNTHEWVLVTGNKARIGITDHAQNELTDIVFVDLPETGKKVKSGEVALVVESVKIAADIYSPLTGTIIGSNSDLETHPEWINEDPYGRGWLFEIEFSESNDGLMDSESYRSITE